MSLYLLEELTHEVNKHILSIYREKRKLRLTQFFEALRSSPETIM